VDRFVRATVEEHAQLQQRIAQLEAALEATVEYLEDVRQSGDEAALQARRARTAPPALKMNRLLSRSRGLLGVSAALVIGIGAGAALFWRGRTGPAQTGLTAPANGNVLAPNHAAPLTAADHWPTTSSRAEHETVTGMQPVSSAEQAKSPSPALADGLTVGLTARNVCWVGATVDRGHRDERLLQPGETVTLHAHGEVVLRVGNASALSVTVNGLPTKSLGRPGESVTTHITLANYQQLVQAPNAAP
jgi:cytoskeletal protein RodZ